MHICCVKIHLIFSIYIWINRCYISKHLWIKKERNSIDASFFRTFKNQTKPCSFTLIHGSQNAVLNVIYL